MSRLMKQIRAIAEEVSLKADQLSSAKYALERRESGDLLIKFDDGLIEKIPMFPFRPYQIEAVNRLFTDGIRRLLLSRPRRSGKEVESWNMILQGAVERPGMYLMVYPTNVRARGVLWDGAIMLKDKSLKFLDMIPKRLIKSVNNQEMKVYFKNGSVIWVLGSDIDPDKLRGTNPLGIAYSEFAFQDPRVFHVMLPALRQNNGWMVGQSTFDGQNHFYHLIQNNKENPLWYCRVDSIVTLVDDKGDRFITDDMIEEDRKAGMPEYLIQQEYYGVVEINQESKYFAHAVKNIYETEKIKEGLFIPNGNVYTAWDIGINDCTSVTIFQIVQTGHYLKPIIIGYFENNNRDLKFYVDEVRKFCNTYNLVLRDHYFPHDGQKRDFNTGKNTVDFMREMGENAFIVPRPTSKENAIEAMRRILYICEFNKEHTVRLIDCISNYSKEYDEKMGTYKNRPLHNWASHGVDSFQTMTLALDGQMINVSYHEVVYIN